MSLIYSQIVDLEDIRKEYLHYINVILPSISLNNKDYPVHLNHCWARIVLDNVCGQKWTNVLDRPAYKCLSKCKLIEAIKLCKDMCNNPFLVKQLNDNSLKYRQKYKLKDVF